MKTGEKNITKDVSENNDIAVIIKTGSKRTTPVLITVLPLLSMLAVSLPGILKNSISIETARLGIITLLLTGVTVFYIRLNSEGIFRKKLAKTIIILGYLSSILLLLFVPSPEIFSFWMIGGLITAMFVDSKAGLLMHFNLSFIMGISLSVRPETVIQVLIIGVLMSMLAGALRQKASVIYAAIIILSTNITIAFAINNFIFETDNNYDYLNSFFSIFAVLAGAFLISLLYGSAGVLQENAESETEAETVKEQAEAAKALQEIGRALQDAGKAQAEAETNKPDTKLSKGIFSEKAAENVETAAAAEQELTSGPVELTAQEVKAPDKKEDAQLTRGTRTSYEVLCDFENELLKKLMEYSENLHAHAMRIGDLSYRAALQVGADEMLCLAGGLYHEIGKINGKNYIEEGLIIAEDYAFPKELKAILKEHNIKYGKPGSIEAAIVMLSDSVESTIEYIEKNDDHRFTTDKIIENIFQMRMDKGTFDASPLSLKDYRALKEFYQKEFSNEVTT